MAEYYPLLAKAVGSLPNSTPETRRVVYERARKALIGQLRTLHPPVPDEDIERESVELDRAIARIEDELAAPAAPRAPELPPSAPAVPPAAVPGSPPAPAAVKVRPPPVSGTKPIVPLRTKLPARKPAAPVEPAAVDATTPEPRPQAPPALVEARAPPNGGAAPPEARPSATGDGRARLDTQRPIAPQPPSARGPKRQMWIIWVGVGVVVALVALAAIKLRDRPEQIARVKATEPQQGDNGKIAERVGGPASGAAPSSSPSGQSGAAPEPPSAPSPDTTAASSTAQAPASAPQAAAPETPAAANPEVPVAQRAALLVEAPSEQNKVKTYLGNVVWKLNNVADGPSDAVGIAVEADVDLPDDKLKATITFEKNTDASLPASHTIKVRFLPQPGSASGDVKQISVPQLRKEDSPSGEPLAGVTVPVIQNSFLVGLSPGNAEAANMELLRNLQWIDIPMLLANGRIAKLTFEKGAAGQRDINDAITAWEKP